VDVKGQIEKYIIAIDEKIQRQVNIVLHHKKFQTLEASWRGLFYLIQQACQLNTHFIKIKVFNISYFELYKDLWQASDFDQSIIFKKIYSDEYDQAGGEPYGLLLGDYFISHKVQQRVVDGIEFLQKISKVAAAAFAPFITGVKASFFVLVDFSELQLPVNLYQILQQEEYRRWRAMRQGEDMRFVGLLLPEVLARCPYQDELRIIPENTHSIEDYLWGNPCYHYAARVMRVFAENGWFANICGLEKLHEDLIDHQHDSFDLNESGMMAKKYLAKIHLTDEQERELSQLGFIPFCETRYSKWPVFYSSQSVQQPRLYSKEVANDNAKLSKQLPYLLCACQFAHYLKIMLRNKVGSLMNAEDCQEYLQNWLLQYCSANVDLPNTLKAKYPLSKGKIQVKAQKGLPGNYVCLMHLKPHYQFDAVQSELRLVSHIALQGG